MRVRTITSFFFFFCIQRNQCARGAAAGCGSYFDTIIVRDNGDGTCTMQATIGTATIRKPCNTPVYPAFPNGCPGFNSSLVLVWRRANINAPYQQNMQGWLNAVGIGNPTVFYRPITIYIEHSPNPVPTISPVFFTNMRQVCPAEKFSVRNPPVAEC